MTTVFASWTEYRGCVTSCRHAAGVLGGRWLELADGEPPADAIDCELLVLSSWAPVYEAVLERRARPVVGRWHSSVLQTELSREGWKLAHLLALEGSGRLAGVVVDDRELAESVPSRRLFHLPNVFDPSELAGVTPADLHGVNVSLPGEAHGRKNLLVQAAAFERARRDRGWTLHLFGQTLKRPGYARWLELAGVPYREHGVLPRREYLALAAAMDAALVASVTESYGYAAAEHAELGVPVVASAAVRSLGESWTLAHPESVVDVAAALEHVLADPSIVGRQREAVHRVGAANAAIARQTLQGLERLALTSPKLGGTCRCANQPLMDAPPLSIS